MSPLQTHWPAPGTHAVVFSANTLHIMSWPMVGAFFKGVGRLLAPIEGAALLIYGPFRYAGQCTTESNEAFDRMLRERDPRSGIRDIEAVDGAGSEGGIHAAGRSRDAGEQPDARLAPHGCAMKWRSVAGVVAVPCLIALAFAGWVYAASESHLRSFARPAAASPIPYLPTRLRSRGAITWCVPAVAAVVTATILGDRSCGAWRSRPILPCSHAARVPRYSRGSDPARDRPRRSCALLDACL